MWKDKTAKGNECKDIDPETWGELDLGALRIVITSTDIYHRGVWVAHCHQLGIHCRPLGTDSKEESKAAALHVVRTMLNDMIDCLHRAD